MGTFYENIMALCEKKGVTGSKMCTDIGISRAFMTELRKGRRSGATADTAQKIAKYFDVSVGELLGAKNDSVKEETKKDPTEKEIGEIRDEIMDRINNLNPVERLALDQFLDLLEAKRELGKVQNK